MLVSMGNWTFVDRTLSVSMRTNLKEFSKSLVRGIMWVRSQGRTGRKIVEENEKQRFLSKKLPKQKVFA